MYVVLIAKPIKSVMLLSDDYGHKNGGYGLLQASHCRWSDLPRDHLIALAFFPPQIYCRRYVKDLEKDY